MFPLGDRQGFGGQQPLVKLGLIGLFAASDSGRFAEFYGIGTADTLIGVSMVGIVAGVLAQRMPPQGLIAAGTSWSWTRRRR